MLVLTGSALVSSYGQLSVAGFGFAGLDSGVIAVTGNLIDDFLVNGLEEPATSIDMKSGVIAVGMPGHASGAGRVRVFRYNSEFDLWLSDDPLDGAAAGHNFGTSVAFDSTGDFLAVGAPRAGNNGSVEVFAYVASEWTEWQTVLPPFEYSTQMFARFGASVAQEGGWLAMGGPLESKIIEGIGTPATDSGAVLLYQFSFLSYVFRERLQSVIDNDFFGTSVSLSDVGGSLLLAAGAPGGGRRRPWPGQDLLGRSR